MKFHFLFIAGLASLFAYCSPFIDAFLPAVTSTRKATTSARTSNTHSRRLLCRMNAAEEITVMINGLPGPMAMETAKACVDRGLRLASMGLTGPASTTGPIVVQGASRSANVDLVQNIDQETAEKVLKSLSSLSKNFVVVDYTHPSATAGNVAAYTKCNCNFVMGTTGGDEKKINEIFSSGSNYAIIAPNMAKQIVALQLGLQEMASRYPGSFAGYTLSVVESHQSSKADTSGTAKAIVKTLATISQSNFVVEDIVKIREKHQQLNFGVPESALAGHAFHTYRLISPDGSVSFELQHNVSGRRVYAEGTVDAVLYLADLQKLKPKKRLYNMIDVLESGSMK